MLLRGSTLRTHHKFDFDLYSHRVPFVISWPICVIYVLFMFVFGMLSRLFSATLWSPAGKGLTTWLSFVVFNGVLLLSHVVFWVRCDT